MKREPGREVRFILVKIKKTAALFLLATKGKVCNVYNVYKRCVMCIMYKGV